MIVVVGVSVGVCVGTGVDVRVGVGVGVGVENNDGKEPQAMDSSATRRINTLFFIIGASFMIENLLSGASVAQVQSGKYFRFPNDCTIFQSK
jgi:hypothetical protein